MLMFSSQLYYLIFLYVEYSFKLLQQKRKPHK